VLSWWSAVRGSPVPPDYRRYEDAVARGLQSADLVVAPTRAMLSSLECNYGPLNATRVIPNGREPADFPPGRKEPLIFSAGRLWDEAKNVATVAEVAPDLPWQVCVAGRHEHPSGFEVPLRGVQALGQLSLREMAGWLGRSSIYALPARYEPFGLSVLEAAFAGCALVLGDISSLREIWGDAALFVDPESPAQLRTALLRLIGDPALRQEMVRRSRTRAFEFTPERMGRAYLSAYRWLLEPRDTSPLEEDEEVVCAS
jgi:glycogen(starch) synthase